jgi:hypothetical protein
VVPDARDEGENHDGVTEGPPGSSPMGYQVLDKPVSGRIFFEQTHPGQPGHRRRDQVSLIFGWHS